VDDPYKYPFERLEAYRVALSLMVVIGRITNQLPRGHGDIRDQTRRSARSAHLNIAEAVGSLKPGTKASRFETARASAFECAACLREIGLSGLAEPADLNEAHTLLHRLTLMLTRLITYWSQR
jgi:four helix bundle protein